jgi:hypothetical protein
MGTQIKLYKRKTKKDPAKFKQGTLTEREGSVLLVSYSLLYKDPLFQDFFTKRPSF